MIDAAATQIYTLSLHDALPICHHEAEHDARQQQDVDRVEPGHHVVAGELAAEQEHRDVGADDRHRQDRALGEDRKSTRLNSSHGYISYAVLCLKKKKYFIRPDL